MFATEVACTDTEIKQLLVAFHFPWPDECVCAK